MEFSEELKKLVLDTLKKTIKVTDTKSNLPSFVDSSTKAMGFSKINKKGYTP